MNNIEIDGKRLKLKEYCKQMGMKIPRLAELQLENSHSSFLINLNTKTDWFHESLISKILFVSNSLKLLNFNEHRRLEYEMTIGKKTQKGRC